MVEERIGGMVLGDWFLVRMNIAYFCLSASFAEYWHGMYSDSIDLMVLINKSILFCPYLSEFMDGRGKDWWHHSWQLVFGKDKYSLLLFQCFLRRVLAWNVWRFYRFTGIDL